MECLAEDPFSKGSHPISHAGTMINATQPEGNALRRQKSPHRGGADLGLLN